MKAIQTAKPVPRIRPDYLPKLINRWQELAVNLETLAKSASSDKLLEARDQIKGILGDVTLDEIVPT